MTPDTIRIDRRFRGVGRVNRASGTTDPRVKRKIDRMLTALFEDARLDILRALRDGDLGFLQVYDAYQRRALAELPVGNTMPLLSTALTAWIEDATPDYSDKHIKNHKSAQREFERQNKEARIADLPELLERMRETYGKRHPRQFNVYRATALSFIRSTLKRSHALYGQVLAVEERAVPPRKLKPHLTVAAFRGFFPHPEAQTNDGRLDAIAWAMVTTGMHQQEYWGDWHCEADRIHIDGTKNGGRVRDVPLVRVPAVRPRSRDWFEKHFRERMKDAGITPYDLRRTYMQWMEAAGIPRTRRKLYMGHSASDVSSLYERHEITDFLVADAKTLGAFLGITPPDASKAAKPIEVMK